MLRPMSLEGQRGAYNLLTDVKVMQTHNIIQLSLYAEWGQE